LVRKNRRNVTLDSSVLISYVISKKNDSVVKKVVTKSTTDDRLMLTDIIADECIAYTDKPRANVFKDIMWKRLKELCPHIIEVRPMPSAEELQRKYKIRDLKDVKILYSVEMTNSVILVTYDDDFFDGVEGVNAKIVKPVDYLYEAEDDERDN